jgi:hypothetical protein
VSGDADRSAAHTGALSVRGGTGGMTVGLDSVEAATGVLLVVARDAAELAFGVLAAATDADVVAGTVLSRATGLAATGGLLELAGPGGLSGAAREILTTAASVEQAQDAVLFVAGWMAPELVVGVLTLDALGVDVGAVLDRAVFDHPGIADLAGGAEGLLMGLQANPLTAPLVSGRYPAPAPGGDDWDDDVDDDDLDDDDLDDLDDDYEEALGALADSAAVWGLLDDRGRARVRVEAAARPGARAPRDLRELAEDQRTVGDGERYAGHVRVIEVPQPHGSVWLVEISATQDWDPRAGTSLFDLTTDVRLMAQQATVLADGVHRALAQAQAASEGEEPSGAQRDQPAVMLVGHSLGGIAAAGLASSPRFTAEHRVTHVVTMGAPVGRMPIPSDTQVLSLEHARDPVPRLEGQPNPDRATWVTVTRDAPGDGEDRASRTHDVRGYVETAALVDGASDPSVTEWRSGSAAFFAGSTHGPPVIRDYLVERVRP